MNSTEVIVAVMALERMSGVGGLLLQKGRNRIASHLPFSETKVDALSSALRLMAEGYREVKRDVRQVWMEFDGGRLLIVQQQGTLLMLLLSSKAELDIIAGAASVFLSEHATHLAMLPSERLDFAAATSSSIDELIVTGPRVGEALRAKAEATISVWPEARKAIERLLSKVMGRAQAVNLVDRCIRNSVGLDPYRMTKEDLRKLATNILDQVPNTGKRRALAAELEPQLQELSL